MLDFLVARLERAALLAFFVASSSACVKPSIVRFNVEPRRVCPGQPINVSWQVKGEASLSSRPEQTADPTIADPVPVSGSRTFRAVDGATFQLNVRRGKEQIFARQEVTVLRPGTPQTLVIRTRAADEDTLEAIETLPPDVWDPGLKVDTVRIDTQMADRTILLIHDGSEVMLSPDSPVSSGLKGTRVAGCWEMRTRLLPGEVHGDPAHAPPDRLRLEVTLTCGGTE